MSRETQIQADIEAVRDNLKDDSATTPMSRLVAQLQRQAPVAMTPMQWHVLGEWLDGANDYQIAERLEISATTARRHRLRLLRKLGGEDVTRAERGIRRGQPW